MHVLNLVLVLKFRMEGRDSCSGRVLSATKFSTSSYVVGKALRGKDTFSCVLNFINSFQP